MNSEPILEVRHLNVWYRPSGVLRRGRQQVLHDVSFDLYRGEILGLVGSPAPVNPRWPVPFWGCCRTVRGRSSITASALRWCFRTRPAP